MSFPHLLAALMKLAGDAATLPENTDLWTYTIPGFDGSPYITRTLLPRMGNLRPIVHEIHREDADEWMHNHPWSHARFLILSGGYVEERRIDPVIPDTAAGIKVTRYLPGDVNYLDASTYHRVTRVLPDTWTLGLVGLRVQDWGFLVRGVHVPHREYFASRGHTQRGGGKA